jgi:hypothetical protein
MKLHKLVEIGDMPVGTHVKFRARIHHARAVGKLDLCMVGRVLTI